MPRAGLKALFAIFAIDGSRRRRRDWDRLILTASAAATVGLIALYLFGKVTSRW
jgi:hypothetical protein